MLYKSLMLLIAILGLSSTQLKAKNYASDQDSITVYFFLREDCLICQYYSITLQELHETYANDQLQFVGLFPNFSSKRPKLEAFKEKYKIPFDFKTDYYHTKKEAFGATVTPEVVVYNETTKTILYKGRIDDAYARVGKKRRVINTSELKDALEAIQNDQLIQVQETVSIGCFINKNKLTIPTPQ